MGEGFCVPEAHFFIGADGGGIVWQRVYDALWHSGIAENVLADELAYHTRPPSLVQVVCLTDEHINTHGFVGKLHVGFVIWEGAHGPLLDIPGVHAINLPDECVHTEFWFHIRHILSTSRFIAGMVRYPPR